MQMRAKRSPILSPDVLYQATWGAIGVACVLVFFGNLRFRSNVLAVGFEDDFFYYAQVAKNLALHGRSTFDGAHLTNGYHPLWMLILTIQTFLFSIRFSSPLPFALSLEIVQTSIVFVSCYFAQKLCSLYLPAVISASIVLLFATFDIVQVRTGMEVGLTLALGFGLLWFRLRPSFRPSVKNHFVYGLFASIMILSRLDSTIFVACLILLDIVLRRRSEGPHFTSAIAFGLGLFPVGLYVVMNWIVFGVLTPISGSAKQLRFHHTPSVHALRSFVSFFFAASSPLLFLCFLLTLCGIPVLLVSRMKRRIFSERWVILAALLFPCMQLLAVTSLSDWQLWQWYLYPWLLSGVVAAIVLFSRHNEVEPGKGTVSSLCFACSLVFLLGYAGIITLRSNPAHNLTYAAALEIGRFAESHPGTYAMGDRSGAVGYLVPVPIIQTEGLMMDKQYLDNIRQDRDLLNVLSSYHVRYYISTRSSPDSQGCYAVKEPWQAGTDSHSMHTTICRKPVAVLQHGTFVNHIFDLGD